MEIALQMMLIANKRTNAFLFIQILLELTKMIALFLNAHQVYLLNAAMVYALTEKIIAL